MNERDDLGGRMTPRGAELLESLLDEMRGDVLQSAARRGLGVEISARDVIEAFEERTGERRVYKALLVRRQSRTKLLLAVYAATGAVTALAAVLVSVTNGASSEFAPLLATISMAIVAASLAILVTLRRSELKTSAHMREEERRQSGFTAFMDRWLRIESLLRLIAAKDLGASTAEMPLGAILDASFQDGRLDKSSYTSLRQLLTIRNEAVHGVQVDEEALREAIRKADRLVFEFEEELAR